MANTENIEAKLCAYIDGDLDAAGRLEIEKHLAANPQHRGLIEHLSKQRDLLRELPRKSAPEEILEALQSQMERAVLLGDADAAAEAGTLKIQRWPQLMAAAAIVLLTIGLGAVIYMVLPRQRGGGGDARYAVTTTRSATLEEREVATIPDAVARGGSSAVDGALDGAGAAVVPGKSALSSSDAPDALAATPDVPEVLSKDKAGDDIFAPNAPGRAGGESALAAGDLLDVQNRLQNADLAKQLKEAPGGLHDNAMFVVVHTADPSAARSEVTNYLASNKIAWDSVAHPTPELDVLAGQSVSLSRAQRVNVQRKSGEPQVGQQEAQPEAQKKAEASTGSTLAGAGAVEQQQQPAAMPAQQTRQELSGVADATHQVGQRAETLSNIAAPDPALLEATSQPQQQQQQQLAQQPFHVQQTPLPAREGRLIIARGMTKQQAAELSSNLSKQTTVQRAAVYEQRPLAARAAAPVLQRTRDQVVPTTGPTATMEPDEFARELAAPAPATAPTTQQVILDAAPTTQELAQPATTTAPAPISLGTTDAPALADPATQPAVSGALDEERVDVVILVQDDEAPAVLEQTEVPDEPNAAPAPTTNPATTAPSAPTTQPAPELTF